MLLSTLHELELFKFTIDAGFRPGSRACCLARPEGRNFRLVGYVGHDQYVEQKDPKPLTPRPAFSKWMDASQGRADQLAELVLSLIEGLKQGPSGMEAYDHGDGRQASDNGRNRGRLLLPTPGEGF